LDLICNIESLELGLSEMEDFEDVPDYNSTVVLSNLKRLHNSCELSIDFHQYLSRLIPNLEKLDLSQIYDESSRCNAGNCPNILEISCECDYAAVRE
jgi:hypothetical protein